MTYCDAVYLALFLPLTIIIYSIMPKKHRAKVLLLASYIFFWSISRKLIVYVWASTLSIFVLNIGVLLVVKYTGFVGGNINTLFKALSLHITLKIPKILMPIGISFYTLQAVSYLFDVYHEKIKADNNLGRLALYMCFFPQIMEGPICRYSETAMQLWEGNQITYQNLKNGIIRIGYKKKKKMIIADRLNEMIKVIFTDYMKYDGGIMVAGMVLYTLQLYMDFSGTMDMVIGSSEIFGVILPENFKQPFFSRNISEFWTRWHITLGAFFRDYIFYPLSLSEPLKKLTTNGRKV